MQVLSAVEMQACDRLTSERYGIASIDLMRNAARSVADVVRCQFPEARRVTVLCGRGNNGGDGLMAARLLAESIPGSPGLAVKVLFLGSPKGLGPDVMTAWRELLAGAVSGSVHVIETEEGLAGRRDALQADLFVDAIVGTGFKPPLRGLALAALDWLQQAKAHVLSVDLPSGWSADATHATAAGRVFPSDAVVTFTAPKPAHVFGHLTRRWHQPVMVAPIGSPPEVIISSRDISWTGTSMELVRTPRAFGANKGNFGHVLVVGGSVGRSGAPAMTALAALRSGAGLVTAAVPAPVQPLVAAVAPELMTWPLAANFAGGISPDALGSNALAELTAGKTVMAVGPGLGQSAETAKFVAGLLAATKIPAVLDADALNILASKPVLLAKLAKERTLVLTPHPGEMARLAGISVPQVQAQRVEVASAFAKRFGVTLVLKGARTVIAHPDGRIAVNTTGNPGMGRR